MKYQNLGGGSSYPFPNHDVSPDKKNSEWCMAYAKAAYYDFTTFYPKGVFYNNGGNYQKNRMYALGKQNISQYKKMLGVDTLTDNTWLSLDWTVRAVVSGYRDKVIAELMKDEKRIVATPVDSQAKSDTDNYYAKMKAKLAVRQLMLQQNPELASHPLIAQQTGDPLDMEELAMRTQMGEQFNRSQDAELAIELGLYENGYTQFRKAIYEDLFDYGVGGYCEWLGDDNKAKFRRVDPECVITSYSKSGTFDDIVHAGEVIEVPLIELALLTDEQGNPLFDEEQLTEFAGSIAGKFGNPMNIGNKASGFYKPYDKFKCKVLDIKFYTYNEYSYNDAYDENGNSDFRKAAYGRGKKSDKYKRKKFQFVYKCKWIIGTDKCYDWGMEYDQKRSVDLKLKAKTKLPYTFIAYNFYQMMAQSFMDKLIPYIDEYQLTCLKIQNFKNRAVPSGWWIDLDSLEGVALNKGGKNMTPKELLQMFFETGVLVGRSKDAAGNPQSPNWKPIIPIENTAASELAMFYQDLLNTIMAIEKMTGFNDITSGNPNPKTLVPGYEIGVASTKNALYPLAYSETYLSTRLAEDVLCRMKQGIKKGEITGYAPYSGALGVNTIRFIEIDSDISLRDHGIELQEATTEQEKAWIFQQVQVDIANGFLNVADAIMIIETQNAKQAMSILAYRVKKEKETQQQQKMAQLQMQNQGAQQAAQIAQQGAAAQLQMELQAKIKMQQDLISGEIQKEQMRIQSAERIAMASNQTKIAVSQDTGNAKENASHITAMGSVVKQHVANQKETATP